MINHNIDVENSIANGAMCKFNCVKLKCGYQDCETVNIDRYYVCCINADKVEYIEVKLEEGSPEKILKLQPVETSAFAFFPVPTGFETEVYTYQTDRMTKKIQLTQFPVNIATARTVHKLQGRSLQNLFVSSWSYTTSNWIYVVLSRVKTSNGLFVRTPLLYTHTNTAESEKDVKAN